MEPVPPFHCARCTIAPFHTSSPSEQDDPGLCPPRQSREFNGTIGLGFGYPQYSENGKRAPLLTDMNAEPAGRWELDLKSYWSCRFDGFRSRLLRDTGQCEWDSSGFAVNCACEAEAQVVVAVVGVVVVVAIGDSAVPGVVVPAAAPFHAVIARHGTTPI